MFLNGDSPLYVYNNSLFSENPRLSESNEDSLDVGQILSSVRRRWLLLTGVSVTVTSGFLLHLSNQDSIYNGKFKLLVDTVTGNQEFKQFNQAVGGQANASLDYDTQIQVLWSSQVISPILNEIQSEYPEINYGSLLGKLKINRLKETKILEVNYQDSDPQKIKFVLEKIANGYIKYSQQLQETGAKQGLNFVEKQLPELQNRVNILQEKLQKFRQQYNLMNPEVQGQLVSNRLNNIIQERQATQTQIGETEELYNNLQQQLDLELNQATQVAILSESTRYQSLLQQLQEIDSKIAVESVRFTDLSPQIQILKEERNNLLPLIRQEASNTLRAPRNSTKIQQLAASPSSVRLQLTHNLIEANNRKTALQIRHQHLTVAENQLRSQIQQLAVVTRQYTDMQRELKVATESLNRFLVVKENLQIETAQTVQPWQVLSELQAPRIPIAPNMQRGLLLGSVAGLLMGVGTALVAEKLDNKFHSPEELKEITRLAILGTIPFQKELRERQTSKSLPLLPRITNNGRYNTSPFLEAFRSLITNLSLISPDRSLRSLVISSSLPMEGKSTTTVFLAQAAAAMGQRVLLVDADLRRPRIHLIINSSNVWGLSHVISTGININDVIQQSSIDDNLYVLTSGQIPPDPTRLLWSKKMQSLVEELQDSFDLVIFDTPPLAGLADAKLLSTYTDGLVMVVGLGSIERPILKQVLDSLKISNTPLLGLIANGVKGYTPSSTNYYYSYYNTYNNKESINKDANPIDWR